MLSLHLAGVEDELPLTGGHAVEFVLAEHAQDVPELDAFTRGWLAEYFGDTARVEIVGEQLLLRGETVSEQTAHFYRDSTCTPNGRAGAASYAGTTRQLGRDKRVRQVVCRSSRGVTCCSAAGIYNRATPGFAECCRYGAT